MKKPSYDLFAASVCITASIANIDKITGSSVFDWVYSALAVILMMLGISFLKRYFKES